MDGPVVGKGPGQRSGKAQLVWMWQPVRDFLISDQYSPMAATFLDCPWRWSKIEIWAFREKVCIPWYRMQHSVPVWFKPVELNFRRSGSY